MQRRPILGLIGFLGSVVSCTADPEAAGTEPIGEALFTNTCALADLQTIYTDGTRVQRIYASDPEQVANGTLTESGRDEIAAIWASLSPGDYSTCSYSDGCVTRIALEAGELSWCFDREDLPEQVEAAATVTRMLSNALWTCEDEGFIVVDPGCEFIIP